MRRRQFLRQLPVNVNRPAKPAPLIKLRYRYRRQRPHFDFLVAERHFSQGLVRVAWGHCVDHGLSLCPRPRLSSRADDARWRAPLGILVHRWRIPGRLYLGRCCHFSVSGRSVPPAFHHLHSRRYHSRRRGKSFSPDANGEHIHSHRPDAVNPAPPARRMPPLLPAPVAPLAVAPSPDRAPRAGIPTGLPVRSDR